MENNELFKFELHHNRLAPEVVDELVKHSKNLDELASYMDALNRRYKAVNGIDSSVALIIMDSCKAAQGKTQLLLILIYLVSLVSLVVI